MQRAGCPRVTQPFATLYTSEDALTVRLACVRRAASVHPEPGSNSPFKISYVLLHSYKLKKSLYPSSNDPLIWIRLVSIKIDVIFNSNVLAIFYDFSITVSGFQGSQLTCLFVSSREREELLYAIICPIATRIDYFT